MHIDKKRKNRKAFFGAIGLWASATVQAQEPPATSMPTPQQILRGRRSAATPGLPTTPGLWNEGFWSDPLLWFAFNQDDLTAWFPIVYHDLNSPAWIATPLAGLFAPPRLLAPFGTPTGRFRRDDVGSYYLSRLPRSTSNDRDPFTQDYADPFTENYRDPMMTEREGAAPPPPEQVAAEFARAWREGVTEPFADCLPPGTRLAVHLRGRYAYALEANDFLERTREAMESMTTVRLVFAESQRRPNEQWLLTARHTYQVGDESLKRTVLVRYLLEERGSGYALIQIALFPDESPEKTTQRKPASPRALRP